MKCKCGCGEELILKEKYKRIYEYRGYPKYIRGHHSETKGRTYEEYYGIERAKEIKEKLRGHPPPRSAFKKGQLPWNAGLTKETNDMLKQMSENRKGFRYSKDVCEKAKQRMLKMWQNPEYRQHMSDVHWQGGLSFEPYGIEFNKELKEQIRERDNHQCQECKFTEEQLGYKLSVHHSDYNKKNNKPSNLISLCRTCHAQTNFNREEWTDYFQRGALEE